MNCRNRWSNSICLCFLIFATGVTDGEILKGVKKEGNTYSTHSVIMNCKDNSIKFITDTKTIE